MCIQNVGSAFIMSWPHFRYVNRIGCKSFFHGSWLCVPWSIDFWHCPYFSKSIIYLQQTRHGRLIHFPGPSIQQLLDNIVVQQLSHPSFLDIQHSRKLQHILLYVGYFHHSIKQFRNKPVSDCAFFEQYHLWRRFGIWLIKKNRHLKWLVHRSY